jgi:hypothetical protein
MLRRRRVPLRGTEWPELPQLQARDGAVMPDEIVRRQVTSLRRGIGRLIDSYAEASSRKQNSSHASRA